MYIFGMCAPPLHPVSENWKLTSESQELADKITSLYRKNNDAHIHAKIYIFIHHNWWQINRKKRKTDRIET